MKPQVLWGGCEFRRRRGRDVEDEAKTNPVNPVILSKLLVFGQGSGKTFDRITGFTGLKKERPVKPEVLWGGVNLGDGAGGM